MDQYKRRVKRKPKKERWKDIKGFEGLYQVSDLGRVRRTNRVRPKLERRMRPKGRIIPVNVTNRNRRKIKLRARDRTEKTFELKYLVADHWLSPRTGAPIEFVDKTSSDCAISNLKERDVEVDRREKLSESQIRRIRFEASIGVKGRVLAKKYNVSTTTISELLYED